MTCRIRKSMHSIDSDEIVLSHYPICDDIKIDIGDKAITDCIEFKAIEENKCVFLFDKEKFNKKLREAKILAEEEMKLKIKMFLEKRIK